MAAGESDTCNSFSSARFNKRSLKSDSNTALSVNADTMVDFGKAIFRNNWDCLNHTH